LSNVAGDTQDGAEFDPASMPPSPADETARWASLTFTVLFLMNLLDYTDRWILSAVMPQIRADLKIDATQGGMLFFWFLISYTLISPVMGYLGDRGRRTYLLGLGVGLWSLASVGAGFAHNYQQLSLARAFSGIGEATYGVIAPTILMDLYRRESRSRVLSYFYLAMPIGAALGITLGGYLGERYGWHTPFFLVGAPGLLAAFAALVVPEPVRGQSEGVDVGRALDHQRKGATAADYRDLMVNSSFAYTVLGMAFYTFAIGGLAPWLPTFLTVNKGIKLTEATSLLGLTTLLAALTGMTAGGWLADRLAVKNPRALFYVPAAGLIGSIPFVLVAIYSTTKPWIFAGVFFAEALMFVNTGPCNAVIANVVMPNLRSVAFAVSIFAGHMLGDLWSPTLMGWVADTFGRPDAMESVFGRALVAIHATPTRRVGLDPENWTAGLLVVVPALLLAGTVLLVGARHLPGEMALMAAKMKASPRPARGTADTAPAATAAD